MQTNLLPRASTLVLLLAFAAGCGTTAVQSGADSGRDPDNEVGVASDVGSRGDAGEPIDEQAIRPTDVPPTMPADVSVTPPRDASPDAECDPASHGLRCGPVGSACGTGGGGGLCSPSSSCTCGRDERWNCTVTFPPGCDGGVVPADAAAPPDGGPSSVCALAGSWRAAFLGDALFFSFTTAGRWMGTTEPGSTAISEGTYTLSGDTVTLTGEVSRGGSGGCAMTDRGVYRTLFRPECNRLRLSRVSEDCRARGDTLMMLDFVRQ